VSMLRSIADELVSLFVGDGSLVVQPRSALTLWFQDRINRNGGRRRKTTIVALARKLLVALGNM
jgi:hypothetical protein